MIDAYLIQCHDRPHQVNALAQYLADGGHDVFIHADARSAIGHLIRQTANIHLVRHPAAVDWGGWTQVEATLKMIEEARNTGRQYRYFHLLSGHCLPLRSMKAMDAILDDAYASRTQFIECEPMPRSQWGQRDGGMHRLQVYYPSFIVSKHTRLHQDYFWLYTNKWLRLKLRRPAFRSAERFYGGAQWFSLTGDAMDAVIAYMHSHRRMVRFFKHTFCSDEMFFQTCLMRSGFPIHTVGNHRYLQWPFANAPSPCDLAPEDWQAARDSGCLFGRKFQLSPAECSRYFSSLT